MAKPKNQDAAKAADDEKAGNVELIALEPILHDGERIEPGEAFTVTRKQAAAHLKNKTAEKA